MRINPAIDELHDQMLFLSLRCTEYAQKISELQTETAALRGENGELKSEIDRLKEKP